MNATNLACQHDWSRPEYLEGADIWKVKCHICGLRVTVETEDDLKPARLNVFWETKDKS